MATRAPAAGALRQKHSRAAEQVKHCPAGASPDWILGAQGFGWGRIPLWETLSVFSRLFWRIWERGCSLCPLNYNKPLPEDLCCSHTPLHIPFKKTVALFLTPILLLAHLFSVAWANASAPLMPPPPHSQASLCEGAVQPFSRIFDTFAAWIQVGSVRLFLTLR